jgi:hypothetical protein
LRGFGVLVSGVTAAKSYVVQRPLLDGRTRRVTIGPANVLRLAEAQERAKEALASFYRGIDLKAGRRGEATLRSGLEDYLQARADLRSRSAKGYRDSVNYLAPWLDLPLRAITREMVENRLREIAGTVATGGHFSGNAAANGAMRALRAIYNFAAERAPATNPMPLNPVRLKKLWLPVEPRSRMVAAEDLPRFYAAVCALLNPEHRDYLSAAIVHRPAAPGGQ